MAMNATDLPWKPSRNGLMIAVRVQPRASKAVVEDVREGVLRVRLTAPPADGAANEQLIKLMAKYLGVPKSRLAIIKGQASREKVVELAD
jgi:hypothetical protein